jgi:hypothetical protein
MTMRHDGRELSGLEMPENIEPCWRCGAKSLAVTDPPLTPEEEKTHGPMPREYPLHSRICSHCGYSVPAPAQSGYMGGYQSPELAALRWNGDMISNRMRVAEKKREDLRAGLKSSQLVGGTQIVSRARAHEGEGTNEAVERAFREAKGEKPDPEKLRGALHEAFGWTPAPEDKEAKRELRESIGMARALVRRGSLVGEFSHDVAQVFDVPQEQAERAVWMLLGVKDEHVSHGAPGGETEPKKVYAGAPKKCDVCDSDDLSFPAKVQITPGSTCAVCSRCGAICRMLPSGSWEWREALAE